MSQKEIIRLLEIAVEAAIEAGEEILQVYDTEFSVEEKADQSPLTLADRNAHNKIVARLKNSALPVLSEEGNHIAHNERVKWDYFWMVDPLDGTKEFVKRNGEFTVNIALIHRHNPIAGVIYVPVKKWLYFGILGTGAYKIENFNLKTFDFDELTKISKILPAEKPHKEFTLVGSRSHMSPETEQFIEELKKDHDKIEIVSMGSSLKICLVAEGLADIYPRFGPTMEWDTAAGQAIVQAAGKTLIDYITGQPMQYNKENLLNNWFIVQ